MAQRARLRVHGHGNVEVELVTSYLTDLNRAYQSIIAFETIIDEMNGIAKALPIRFYPLDLEIGLGLGLGRRRQHFATWPPTADQIASLIPRSEQLVLIGTKLASPGFWEFFGALNPLEVTRKYLNDRHERRKDREYRESAESRRLFLENQLREDEILSGRIKMARDLGATNRELAPLINELLSRPLHRLDRHQDANIIDHAEISGPTEDGEIDDQEG